MIFYIITKNGKTHFMPDELDDAIDCLRDIYSSCAPGEVIHLECWEEAKKYYEHSRCLWRYHATKKVVYLPAQTLIDDIKRHSEMTPYEK